MKHLNVLAICVIDIIIIFQFRDDADFSDFLADVLLMGNRPHRSRFIYYIYLDTSLAYVVYHLIDHIGKGQYNKTSNYDTAVRGFTLISGMTLWSTLCDTESEATLLNITHLI